MHDIALNTINERFHFRSVMRATNSNPCILPFRPRQALPKFCRIRSRPSTCCMFWLTCPLYRPTTLREVGLGRAFAIVGFGSKARQLRRFAARFASDARSVSKTCPPAAAVSLAQLRHPFRPRPSRSCPEQRTSAPAESRRAAFGTAHRPCAWPVIGGKPSSLNATKKVDCGPRSAA